MISNIKSPEREGCRQDVSHAAGPAGCLSRKEESEWVLRRWLKAEEHALLLLRTHDRSDGLSGLHRSLALDTHDIHTYT